MNMGRTTPSLRQSFDMMMDSLGKIRGMISDNEYEAMENLISYGRRHAPELQFLPRDDQLFTILFMLMEMRREILLIEGKHDG
jgi:excinuclease UvrABC nuclease subunit